ncbi:zf-HC2 domain-containing protein [Actinomycetospora endophytica]|uniref:Zf-HC2 domain-containing protein n=1 Tax=Actinomycetospora endophytica TaxID=2291215 RepID=A0ABS8P595_9PSEU|nr:zf-HC2 domain-containing protein [Actinomycetospora endophytica]MCD2193425.1 zf-HC2 domain-containing protein [Actinomycetospora endophytica]
MSAGHENGQDPELAEGVVGRALHALEPDEEDRVAEHLRECAACRALLSETHETMAALAHAVPVVEPSAALRERILAAAAAEPDPPRPAPARERTTRELPAVTPSGAEPTPGTTTGPLPVPLPRRRVAAILALAAVIAGIVVFAARGAAGPDPTDPRTAVAQRAQQVVASAQARDPAVRSASLIQRGNGNVAAVVLDDGSGPRVVPLDLPAIGSGRTFVLWRVAGVSATPVGTVDPTGGSFTPTAGSTPGATGAPGSDGNPLTLQQRAYALSAEPVGPVPTRPTAIVASGPLV